MGCGVSTDHDDEEVEAVYEQIEDSIRKGRGESVIVMGDLNVVVGDQEEENVTGRHGLNSKNDGGQILFYFCKRNKLLIINTRP